MPKELFRISGDIQWIRTIIRRRGSGIETELHLTTREGELAVAIDAFASADFLREVLEIECLAIWEYSAEERGWTEDGRFEIRINDNDDISFATAVGSCPRWGPVTTERESFPSPA